MKLRLLLLPASVCAAISLVGCGGWIVPTNSHRGPVNFKVLYDSDESGNGDIWAVNPDGTGKVNLTNAPGDDEQPAPTFDGSQIYYWHDGQIWLMNADGSNQHLLIDTSATGAFGISVNRANTKLVYYTINPTFEVWIVNVDGSNLTKLTDAGTVGNGWAPVFNAAGDKIFFTSNRSGGGQIYRMNLDGSNQTILPPAGSPATSCDVSRDGTKLLYNNNTDLWVENLDGTSPFPFATTVANISARFAPSGEVVYLEETLTSRDIHVVRTDGTNDRIVASDPGKTCVSVAAVKMP